MASVERLFRFLAPRKEKAFCPCPVLFLGNLTLVFVLRRLQEEHTLFVLKSSQRYFGAIVFSNLTVATFDYVFINCCMVFHPKLSNTGLIAASKLQFFCNNLSCPVLELLQMLNFCSSTATPNRAAMLKMEFSNAERVFTAVIGRYLFESQKPSSTRDLKRTTLICSVQFLRLSLPKYFACCVSQFPVLLL